MRAEVKGASGADYCGLKLTHNPRSAGQLAIAGRNSMPENGRAVEEG
ncbi:hypothetical protein M6D81_19295 [Paenibacillus sp. J5C_2022]|nr:hypothetical protein [Paenibacillus sp. J5C2022]